MKLNFVLRFLSRKGIYKSLHLFFDFCYQKSDIHFFEELNQSCRNKIECLYNRGRDIEEGKSLIPVLFCVNSMRCI